MIQYSHLYMYILYHCLSLTYQKYLQQSTAPNDSNGTYK